MKTRIFTLLFALVASVGILFAESGACGEGITWRLSTKGVLTISGTGAIDAYSICWDVYKERIKKVVINNGITSIGNGAFEGCARLTSVTIPSSVTRIEEFAFFACDSLNAFYINDIAAWCAIDFQKYWSRDAPHNLYMNDALLTDLIIPDSVTSIGKWAFADCTGLTSVTIPSSVTSVGYDAFRGCSDLNAVHINDIAAWCAIDFQEDPDVGHYGQNDMVSSNPLRYAHNLYMNDALLTDMIIPDGVTSIGTWAFIGCNGFTSATIPHSVVSIGGYAFRGCTGLTSVTIGNGIASNSVTRIGRDAFSGCTGLTAVTIGDNVISIGTQAFRGCSSLTSLTIGNNVTSIGDYAFYGCNGLTSVTLNSNAIVNNSDKSSIFGQQVKAYIIGDSVTNIGEYAFNNCTGLTSVAIGDSVTNIGEYAFNNCTGLTSVAIGNSVTNIGGGAFYNCSGLTSVTIGNGVTSIGEMAFKGCASLTSVTIPNSVTSIGYNAFYGCTSLPVIDSVRYADTYLVEAVNKSLKNHTIKQGTRWIGGYAFFECGSLSSVTIPNSVTSIEYYAFSGTSLTSVTIPSSVTSVGYDAFRGCSKLKSVKCLAEVPPALDGTIGLKIEALYVPANSVNAYQNSEWAQYFSNIYGIYDVLFEDREGRLIESQHIEGTDTVIFPEAPDVFGYTFIGWDNDLSNVTENIVVVTAQYTRDAINGLYYIYDREAQTAVLDREDNNYEGITNLTVPNTITYRGTKFTVVAIGEHALEGCDRLTDVVIPNSVENIMPYAFAGCSDMVRLNLGGGIRSVADHAFDGCKRLEDITVYAERVPDLTATSFANVGNKQYINVYVPEARLQFYQRDEYWSEFYLKVKSAEHVDNQTRDEVTVLPDDNSAVFTWPTQTNAETYTIVITKDGEVFCTLIFNANGQLTGIAFAPGKNGTKSPAMATWVNGGMQFTVTGLDAATQYGYELTTKDASSNIIAEYNGSFETIGSTEGLDDTNANVKMKKVIRNGQIIIMRSDKSYTVMGQETR